MFDNVAEKVDQNNAPKTIKVMKSQSKHRCNYSAPRDGLQQKMAQLINKTNTTTITHVSDGGGTYTSHLLPYD